MIGIWTRYVGLNGIHSNLRLPSCRPDIETQERGSSLESGTHFMILHGVDIQFSSFRSKFSIVVGVSIPSTNEMRGAGRL